MTHAPSEHESTEPKVCGKCRQPFNENDTRFWGSHRRYRATPWCCSCVDRCHDNEDAGHRCVICHTY
ncbi:hypothetical protein ACWGBV_03620 [Streptomyces sp. NPDC055051]